MDGDTRHVVWIVGIAVVMVLLCVAVGIGHDNGEEAMRREAVRAGAAEYVADEAGASSFSWKTLESGEKED